MARSYFGNCHETVQVRRYRARDNTRDIQYMAVQYKGGVQYMTNTISAFQYNSLALSTRLRTPSDPYASRSRKLVL